MHIVRPALIGTAIGIVSCVLLLLLAATVMASFQLSPSAATPIALSLLAVSSLIAGFSAARIARERGLLYGIGCGMVLFVITALAGLGVESGASGVPFFWKLTLTVGCGALGGIVGVNLKRR